MNSPALAPVPVSRSRRWLHPARWRFWIVTLPAVFWTGLLILFLWPGLTFEWRLSESFSLSRQPQYEWGGALKTESAHFSFGSLTLDRHIYDSAAPVLPVGFFHTSDTIATAIGYQWSTGVVSIWYYH